jgi:hypothetical protein
VVEALQIRIRCIAGALEITQILLSGGSSQRCFDRLEIVEEIIERHLW